MKDKELDEILARDEQDREDYRTECRWDRYVELRRRHPALYACEASELNTLAVEFEDRIKGLGW